MRYPRSHYILSYSKRFLLFVTICTVVLFAGLPALAASGYKHNDVLTISGQTDFDNPYTWNSPYSFTDGRVTYECFPIITGDGAKWYAAVNPSQIKYYQEAFYGSTLTLKGKYKGTTDDGTPVLFLSHLIQDGEEKELKSYLWNRNIWSEEDESPNFQAFYDIYRETIQGKSTLSVLSISEDGSYLEIDTNPTNVRQSNILGSAYSETTHQSYADECIQSMHTSLGLPSWLDAEMGNTRAIDGMQKEVFDKVTVTWTYHPDQGLEVMYRKNN